jgi:hypothetical protein
MESATTRLSDRPPIPLSSQVPDKPLLVPSVDLAVAEPCDRPTVQPSFRAWLLPLALFSILWIDLIRLLSTEWEAREQYAYGWFVSIFALALFWRRWLDRPRPTGLEARGQWRAHAAGG